MPVYLVACTHKKSARAPSLLKAWMNFIKGPVDHVELSFVEEGRETYGYLITLFSKSLRFCSRDYSTIDEHYDVVWYELPLVDRVDCERHCESRHGKGQMSVSRLMRSAMPFDNEAVARVFADFVETRALPREAFDVEAAPEQEEFCASATMKALQAGAPRLLFDVDPYSCTAFDVVVYAVQRLGAQPKPRPVFNKRVDPEIPRSENWYGS